MDPTASGFGAEAAQTAIVELGSTLLASSLDMETGVGDTQTGTRTDASTLMTAIEFFDE